MQKGVKGEGMLFADVDEMKRALDLGLVDLQATIHVRIINNGKSEIVETTPGRAILHRIVPDELPFSLINRMLKKKDVSSIVNECYLKCGIKKTVVFVDQIMYLGFEYATKSGASIGLDDIEVPEQKPEILAQSEKQVDDVYIKNSLNFYRNIHW